jgi:enoyl-CoA hydratase/carnithine racemase
VIEGLRYELESGVAYITIDRPDKLNALDPAMYEGLRTYVIQSDLDPAVQVIVLRATGDRAFCTGGDLVRGADDWDGNGSLAPLLAGLEGIFPFQSFERCSKLIVTAVNGLAQAAGIIAVLVSDLVIASDRARFRVPETLLGLTDPFIARRLPFAVGLAKARWMIYTADELDAFEAERAGLVARVVPHDHLDTAVDETIQKLRRTGPGSRLHYKRMLNGILPFISMDEFIQSMRSPEAVEGMRSFAEKRPPSWRQQSMVAGD